MHVVVCIKQVPDPQAPAGSFYVDEATNEPRWSPPAQDQISTFDLHAIEAAAQLRQAHGGRVTVVSLGDAEVEVGLRRALAGGCDAALRLDGPAGSSADRSETARWLAAAIARLAPVDLVLCGRLAADWDMGHVPAMLGELLGMAVVTPVVGLEYDGACFRARRLTDEGQEVLEVDLPAVLAVSNELNEPGYPTMRAVLQAQKVPVTTWTARDLGLDEPADRAAARLLRLLPRDLTRECEFIEADTPEDAGLLLADCLRAQGLLAAGAKGG
ncbi:MAG: electron transfer flavoprotein subunit beta/FixA family protein [Dehalococcoidia bacterium]|nr:electron transfer flavoprotein subunit beta/FixA family protein [Dehalococcoidia bacterium]